MTMILIFYEIQQQEGTKTLTEKPDRLTRRSKILTKMLLNSKKGRTLLETANCSTRNSCNECIPRQHERQHLTVDRK